MPTLRAMRRAVLAVFLCAAPLVAAPAYASQDILGQEALRAARSIEAGSASTAAVRALPLTGEDRVAASVASAGELGRIASAGGRVRVLVGVRRHADLAGV